MRITTTHTFDKQFKKQPQKIQKEFARRIEMFLTSLHDPRLNTHKLRGTLNGFWSFNVSGDVRVIFDRSQSDMVMLVEIGSHSELYK